MFYQDSNDYMRDSYFCGNGMNMNPLYSSNGMMYGNSQNNSCMQNMQNPYMQNYFQMSMQQNTANSLENLYPQIYRIINPVANRVISNSNNQFMTEDVLNNMTDTVYNIVEGEVSSLVSMQDANNQGDDTIQVNANLSSNSNSTVNNTRNQNSINNSSSSNNERRGNNSMDYKANNNRLLRDLIKIILIKELLSRRNNHNNYNIPNYMQTQGMQSGNYNYLPYGI